MPKIKRLVVPQIPHHVVNRGNRNQDVFFQPEDRVRYLTLLDEFCTHYRVKIVCYCLMTNHVHLIAIPADEAGLARAIGDTHRAYTRMINFREGWRGHLWQGRFYSCPMDELHTFHAARYILLNPVDARMTQDWQTYPFSSAAFHLGKRRDLVIEEDHFDMTPSDWRAFVAEGAKGERDKVAKKIEKALSSGRPLGTDAFVQALEDQTGRVLRRSKPGPKMR